MSDYKVYFSCGECLIHKFSFHSLAAAKKCCLEKFHSGDFETAFIDVYDSRGFYRWSHIFHSGVWSRRSMGVKVVHV